jgi:hypothetical protein
MALLVYSDKCKFSSDVISFIRSNPALVPIIRYHNISTDGIPSKKISRVPTLVTNDGQLLVGAEVKTWLSSMIPTDFENYSSHGPASSNFDGSDDFGSFFPIDSYGTSLQPTLTPELEERISRNVGEAYKSTHAIEK